MCKYIKRIDSVCDNIHQIYVASGMANNRGYVTNIESQLKSLKGALLVLDEAQMNEIGTDDIEAILLEAESLSEACEMENYQVPLNKYNEYIESTSPDELDRSFVATEKFRINSIYTENLLEIRKAKNLTDL